MTRNEGVEVLLQLCEGARVNLGDARFSQVHYQGDLRHCFFFKIIETQYSAMFSLEQSHCFSDLLAGFESSKDRIGSEAGIFGEIFQGS
jgi:hypothetical protein